MKSYKVDRVQQILIEDINSMIVLGKLRDPRINSLVMVLYVKASPDITNATVYISGHLELCKLEKVVHALNHARGYIQSEIAKKNCWRNTPRLLFKSTNAIKEGAMIIEKITTMNNNTQVLSSVKKHEINSDTETLE